MHEGSGFVDVVRGQLRIRNKTFTRFTEFWVACCLSAALVRELRAHFGAAGWYCSGQTVRCQPSLRGFGPSRRRASAAILHAPALCGSALSCRYLVSGGPGRVRLVC